MRHKRPTKAMLFGAGLGKRMRPLTNNIPKPLVKVNGKPIIDYSLEKLKEFGIEKVVVNTHYKAEKLEEHLSTYEGLDITTIFEPTLLDTGGGLLNAIPALGDDPFFVINGDIIWQDGINRVLDEMSDKWISEESLNGLLLLHKVSDAIGYDGNGDFEIDDVTSDILITNAPEKNFVFTGIQILDPKILKNYKVEPFSIIKVYKEFLSQETKLLENVKAIINSGKWFHVGTPEAISLTESKL